MDAKKREIRNLECQLSFREATSEQAEKNILGTICGRAIVFNAESEVLDDGGGKFREVILPEAAPQAFMDTQDVKINLLHERTLTFARCNKGVGNARIISGREGVDFEVDVPNCDLGIRARELTRAGVYSGCSFEFWPDHYDIEKREAGVPLVKHRSFRMITALTLGMDPAYPQTSLSARELLEHETDEEREAREKREAEEADAKKKAEEEEAARKAQEEEEAAKEQEERERLLMIERERREHRLQRMRLEMFEY